MPKVIDISSTMNSGTEDVDVIEEEHRVFRLEHYVSTEGKRIEMHSDIVTGERLFFGMALAKRNMDVNGQIVQRVEQMAYPIVGAESPEEAFEMCDQALEDFVEVMQKESSRIIQVPGAAMNSIEAMRKGN